MYLNRLACLLFLVVASCASVETTPPVEADVQNSREIGSPYEKSWERAVAWFAEHALELDKIDKSSGLITAKYVLLPDAEVVDCGALDFTAVRDTPDVQRTGLINVRLKQLDARSTEATMNLFGGFRASAVGLLDDRRIDLEGTCYSTGEIEQEFLDFVEGLTTTTAAKIKTAGSTEVSAAATPTVAGRKCDAEARVQSEAVASNWQIQLASIPDRDDVDGEWTRLTNKHRALLCGLSLDVQRVALAKGVYYRMRAGPFPDRAAASALCTQLRNASQPCLLVERSQP